MPALLLLLAACGAPDAPDVPTWSEDVKPIVDASCAACHVEGGAGGFALDSYEALAMFGPQAADAVAERRMPPWMPDGDCREYMNDRSLSQADVDTFVAWVDGGMPEGDPALAEDHVPEVTPFEPTHSAAAPGFTPDTSGGDAYRCFVLDLDFPEPLYLRASDVTPDSGQVHHVLVYGIQAAQLPLIEALDGADGQPGYSCFGGPLPGMGEGGAASALGMPVQLGAWVPGSQPNRLPEDSAARIEAGMKVVMQVHYSALGGAPSADATQWRAELSEEAPGSLLRSAPLPVRDLDIPAGALASAEGSFPYYGPPLLLSGFAGHMHQLGQQIEGWIERADGREECLLDIPDWDFEWQQSYALYEDDWSLLERGDRVHVRCAYDNTEANQPVVDGAPIEPRDVTWGDGTLDEMCLLYVSRVVPFSPPLGLAALPCDGVEACEARCEDPDSIDCALSCEETVGDCGSCALLSAAECAVEECPLTLLGAQACLQECGVAALMLGGNVGQCMAAECPEAYDAVLSCVDPMLADGGCGESLAACGL